ncbi:hypothetical protein NE865_12832 [Phthorimaea operculella]|nr:hypothetical protein NE865_12832 [Phthorimaea operculella]
MQSKHPTNCRGRYICEICDASFIQKSKLQRHKLVIHTKEKKYACKECGKAFNNACSLRKHGLLHSGERPYMCPHCPRLFRDSSNLKKHINNKHSSTVKPRPLASQPQSTESQAGTEVAVVQSAVAVAQNALALVASGRKHQCDSCQKSFHSGKDLRRHEKVHKDDKPFECKIRDMKCKQPRFRRLDNLNRHLRNTHGIVEPRPVTNGLNGTVTATVVEKDEVREKAKLEVLNPLPPLPDDFIQKHLYTEEKTGEKTIDNEQTIDSKELAIEKKLSRDTQVKEKEQVLEKINEKPAIEKSKIIEANTARQSVIVGTTAQERKVPSPVTPYVHKIRKANSLCGQKVNLPPIDTSKIFELEKLYPHSKEEPAPRPLDVAPLRVKDVETLKNILHDKADKPTPQTPPAKHWRKQRLTDNE